MAHPEAGASGRDRTAERVIFTEKVRGGAAVADTAIALANSVHQGARPWEEPRDAWFRVKQYMNWG
jgi:hypothetical protein